MKELLQKADELGAVDCQDWALTQIGLPQYVHSKSPEFDYHLLWDIVPELREVDKPIVGDLVVYRRLEDGAGTHFGVVESPSNGVIVESKWGTTGDIFRHSLEEEFDLYGSKTMFYRLVDQESKSYQQ